MAGRRSRAAVLHTRRDPDHPRCALAHGQRKLRPCAKVPYAAGSFTDVAQRAAATAICERTPLRRYAAPTG